VRGRANREKNHADDCSEFQSSRKFPFGRLGAY